MTVQEILDELHVDFREGGHHHCRPGWVQICCPWCDRGAKKFHLGCNLALKYWNCWGCGGKSMFAVLVKLGLDRRTAEQHSRSVDTSRAEKRERARVSLKIPHGLGPLLPLHREYLQARGFDPDEIATTWKVQGLAQHPRLAWRLYIPIEQHEILISWTTRTLNAKSNLRYISASADEEAVNHKDVLYGEDYCQHSIVICEGPTDVWRIGKGAVATFGTAFSEKQVRAMLQHPYRYVCFDSEPTAQKQAQELCGMLSVFPGVTMNIELDAEDPGSASASEIGRLRRLTHLD